MNKESVLKFAIEAGMLPMDATSVDALQTIQGDIMKFVELVTDRARDEGFEAGQNNILESIRY